MPPNNRDGNAQVYYETLKDVFDFLKSGQPRQGWQHWRDFIHRNYLQLGYEHPLSDPTLKIKVWASVLLIVWFILMTVWAAVIFTTDAITEDFTSKGRFQEFYAIPRVLPFTKNAFYSLKDAIDGIVLV
ncbi:uncharacterized protein LOC110447958 isoform X2 [Mizuhopecten yessoensis]|uniref:uncharacterized protein LOC110447958 isoform X2 n=1 Tax=Mizuhopecten yessoensis TaxID=6573 RepID=UPI000B4576A9|nr:uncharacterized protein LOC110447958 isoform X2 [Mizuhopecten yessoensis]